MGGGIGAPDKLIVKGKRLDGRKLDELRPITVKAGIIPNADGSAYYKQGSTEIIAAVYGPSIASRYFSDPNKAYFNCSYSMASFSTPDRVRPGPSRRSTDISTVITAALTPAIALEKYPKTRIDVIVTVINACGGTRCAAINAVAVALADAGIEMKDIVAAVAMGKIDEKLALDLCDIEDNFGQADMALAFTSRTGNITLLQMDGHLSTTEIKTIIETCKTATQTIFEAQREALRKKYAVESEVSE